MATGDSADILARVKAVIPRRWFSYVAPIRDAIIGGLSDGAAWSYSWLVYIRQQSRIATSTGPFLDLIAWDYFGARFLRRQGEADVSFRPRILQEILRSRSTRAAILQMLSDLTGRAAKLIEPWNPNDCGAYGVSTSGYGRAGCYGSLQFKYQIFVTTRRPAGNGIANVSGYGNPQSGYGAVGSRLMYADRSMISGAVPDAEIYARITQTIAAGITAWVNIQSGPIVPPPMRADLAHNVAGNSQYLMMGL